MGEVAEGFVFNLLTDAKGAAEQVGGIDFAFAVASGGGYMNRTRSRWHRDIIAQKDQNIQNEINY